MLIGACLLFATADWANYGRMPADLLRGDLNIIELRVIESTRHLLLVGPYSRDGFFHPGPLLYYVLAPFYRLAGGGVVGITFGAVSANVLALALSLVAAYRMNGIRLVALVGAGEAVFISAYWPLISMPWNPVLAVFPFVLVVIASWAVAEGRYLWAPVAAASGSLAVQSHVGYAGVTTATVVGGAMVAAARAWRHRRADMANLRSLCLWLGTAAVVALVLWIPPVIGQVTMRDGHLSTLVRALERHQSGPGGWAATRAVLNSLRLDGDWITGQQQRAFQVGGATTLPNGVGLPLLPGVFLIAGWYAWRRSRQTAALFAILAVTFGAAAFSLAKMDAPQFLYLYLWLPVVAMLAWVAILALAIDTCSAPDSDGWSRRSAIVVLVALTGVVAYQALRFATADIGELALVAGLLAMAVSALLVGVLRSRGPRAPRVVLACAVSLPLILGVASIERANHLRDAQPAFTADARQQLSFVSRIAEKVPANVKNVDLRWEEDARLEEMPQLVATALAQRGFDVRLPLFSTAKFGPELTATPDPRISAVWLLESGRTPTSRAIRIASWQNLVAYRVPPAARQP